MSESAISWIILPVSGSLIRVPGGDGDYNILAASAVHFRALTVFAVLGCEFALITECKKGVCTLVNFDDDITASAAVTAVRTACGYVFFAAE